MLGFIKKDNYIEFICAKKTKSYNPKLCKDRAFSYTIPYDINYEDPNEGFYTIEKLDTLLGDNPLATFRDVYYDQQNHVLSSIKKTILNPKNNTHKLIYTTTTPWNTYSDINTLTQILVDNYNDDIKYRNLTLNWIWAYNNIVNNSHWNENLKLFVYDTEAEMEETDHIHNSIVFLMYRMIKIIEYFKALGVKIHLRMYDTLSKYYDQCKIDSSYKSDIFVSNNYVKLLDNQLKSFQFYSLNCTNGFIAFTEKNNDGFEFMVKLLDTPIQLQNDNDSNLIDLKWNQLKTIHRINDQILNNTKQQQLNKIRQYETESKKNDTIGMIIVGFLASVCILLFGFVMYNEMNGRHLK